MGVASHTLGKKVGVASQEKVSVASYRGSMGKVWVVSHRKGIGKRWVWLDLCMHAHTHMHMDTL